MFCYKQNTDIEDNVNTNNKLHLCVPADQNRIQYSVLSLRPRVGITNVYGMYV
jgi:hypothetical protein